MTLTKETVEDKIEVIGDYKAIQIRTAVVIKDNGTEISRSFHRRVIHPCTKSSGTWSDTDTSSESTEVQAIASAVWTDAVKTAYKTMVDAQSI